MSDPTEPTGHDPDHERFMKFFALCMRRATREQAEDVREMLDALRDSGALPKDEVEQTRVVVAYVTARLLAHNTEEPEPGSAAEVPGVIVIEVQRRTAPTPPFPPGAMKGGLN